MHNKSICFLLPGWISKQIGGAELQLFLLTEELVKRGWMVEVITSRPNANLQLGYLNEKIKYHYYKQSKIQIFEYISIVFNLFRTNSYFYYVRTNAKLLRGCARSYSKLFNKKIIYALAGDDELDFKGFDLINTNNLIKNIIYNGNILFVNFLIRNQYIDLDLIIAQTEFQKQRLKKTHNLDAVIVKNSFVFLNDQEFEKENIVLWVGNFRKIKQPELFIEIANNVRGTSWRFVMIGKQNDYFEHRAIHNSNVEMLGELTYKETISWIAKSKMLVNTSLTEGFSNTFLEAWGYGTLVISLGVDPDRLLSKEGLGLYCEHSKIKLIDTVKTQVMKELDYNIFIEKGKEYVSRTHSLGNNVDTFLNILEKI